MAEALNPTTNLKGEAFNPRWLAWCRSLGLGHDTDAAKARFPETAAMEFMLWNSGQLRRFQKVRAVAFMDAGSPSALVDQAAYDAWLLEEFPMP